MKNTEATMETATFYVGDLCYVLTDSEWDIVCAGDFDGENYLDPDGYDIMVEKSGRPYSIFRTEYGDGYYSDKEGRSYAVDSGTIGCIAVSNISESALLQSALDRGLGQLHELDVYTVGSATCESGVMTFDTVIIETA